MRFVFLFISTLTCFFLLGQAIPGNSIMTGLYGEMPYVRDEFMSPLNYTGPGGGAFLGYQYRNPHHFVQSTLNLGGNYLHPAGLSENPSRLYGLRIKLNAQWNRRIISRENTLEWLTGIGWQNKIDFRYNSRFSNSSVTYDVLSSVTWSNIVQKQFHFWNRHWNLAWNSDLMLMSVGSRPGYSTQLEGSIPISIYAWNNSFAFDNQFQLSLLLSNGNAVYLGYGWETLYIAEPQKLYKGIHQILIGTNFRLSR